MAKENQNSLVNQKIKENQCGRVSQNEKQTNKILD